MNKINFKKVILLSLAILLVVVIISGLFIKNRVQTQVKELFRMNKVLQEEGYYMAEFEFKMMGFLYDLDKGHYFKALTALSDYHTQLKNKENLIKLPEFNSTEDEMNFYLDLQNPRTGAFMDDASPYCTYNEPTENAILHLENLAKKRGVALKLKYPLSYLDQINTTEKLYAFLDDVAYVGWLGSRFPETSFVFARSLLSYWNDEGVIARNNLYHFPNEYKQALLKWFYSHQDSSSGYWGPMSVENGQLITIDLNNTASIIKTFIDKKGDNIHKAFPLKYKDKIFATTLALLQKALPEADALAEWHAWNVSTRKGLKMLLRYLWKDVSSQNRQKARTVIENYIKVQFEKFYIPKEGAFSYYPHAEHASLDGTGALIYKEIGAYSAKEQKMLWDNPESNIKSIGHFKRQRLTQEDLVLISNNPGINSLRLYDAEPDIENLTASVFALLYPKETAILDVVEVVPQIKAWLDTAAFSMGNWTSKEGLRNEYAHLNIKKPLVFKKAVPLDELNKLLRERKELHIIGFDLLQIPRYSITFEYSPVK